MSRRSITSAAVVPTASEDNARGITDHPVQAEPKVTQPAFDSQTIQVVANSPAAAESDNEFALQQTLTTGTKPHPVSPLAITQSVHQNGHAISKRVKNYRALVNSFKHMQPFARDPDGNYPVKTNCVFCSTGKPTSVFFPCQHMCVCNQCVTSNDMSPDFSMNPERCVCPVCGVNIHLILPHTGSEEEKYWNWVLSTKPTLPSGFLKSFKSAGKKLSEDSLAESRKSTVESNTPRGFVDSGIPLQRITRPSRGNTWAPTLAKRASAYKLGVSKKQESCSIL